MIHVGWQASIIDPLPGGKSQLTWLSCVDPGGLRQQHYLCHCWLVDQRCFVGKLPTAKQTTAKKAAESVLALQTYCLKGLRQQHYLCHCWLVDQR